MFGGEVWITGRAYRGGMVSMVRYAIDFRFLIEISMDGEKVDIMDALEAPFIRICLKSL